MPDDVRRTEEELWTEIKQTLVQSGYFDEDTVKELATNRTAANGFFLSDLTEEQAYYVLIHAGQHGYNEAMRKLRTETWLTELRRWVFWCGGWEVSGLLQLQQGKAWELKGPPWPIVLFGGLITLYSAGWDLKLGKGYLCYWKCTGLYWSPDGTPYDPSTKFIWRKRNS